MQTVADNTTRIIHESQMWPDNSFITLTYGPGNLPANSALEHRDYQLFTKRLRKLYSEKTIRFYMCGEYGDENGRPHYHACIFNHAFEKTRERGKSGSGEIMWESTELNDLWGMGTCTTQDLTPNSAAYVAGYVMKKTKGQESSQAYGIITPDGEYIHREPPYSKSSLKPGIGATWFDKHGKTDIINHNYVIQDGIKKSVPKYYRKLIEKKGLTTNRYDQLRADKLTQINRAESLPHRLKVREEVHYAKIRNLKREL